MSTVAEERIHSLEIPLLGTSLLVPSAAVAEVTNPIPLYAVPGAPRWVMGVMGWRSQPVPVVSFEGLMGREIPTVSEAAKMVVFYPLAGPRDWEFYALLAVSEPRPQPISPSLVQPADAGELPQTPYIAAGVKIKGRLLFIPDFDALGKAFYP